MLFLYHQIRPALPAQTKPPAGPAASSADTAPPSRLAPKPHPVTMAVDTVKNAIRKVAQYLNNVQPCSKQLPLAVQELKTNAYALSLPTSGQLQMINRMKTGCESARGTDPVWNTVGKHLDDYNEQAHRYNELHNAHEEASQRYSKLSHLYDEIYKNSKSIARKRKKISRKPPLRTPHRASGRKTKAEKPAVRERLSLANPHTENTPQDSDKALRFQEKILKEKLLVLRQERAEIGLIRDGFEMQMTFESRCMENTLGMLDQALESACQQPGCGRAGAYQALRNGLRDAETLRGLRTDWRYWEMLGVSPAEYDDVADNPDPIMEWLDAGFSAKEALSFRNAGWKPEQVLHLKGTGITGPLAKEIHRFGYTKEFFEQASENGKPVSAAELGFILGNHHDAWTEDQAHAIGRGAFNTPMQGHFMDSDSAATKQAPASVWVFKKEQYVANENQYDPTNHDPLPLEPGETATGPEENAGLFLFKIHQFSSDETFAAPRLGARNVAAWRVAEKFGWPVIARTEFAARTIPLTERERAGHASRSGTRLGTVPRERFAFGIMMERAQPYYGMVKEQTNLADDRGIDANIRRNLVKLQILDLILGQADRHLLNFIIDAGGKVTGIDNDQCLPDELDDPSTLAGGNSPEASKVGLHGLAMPRVIDKEMQREIMAFSERDLRTALRGLVPLKAIEAAVARMEAVKQWIGGPHVKVIDPKAWSSDEVTELLLQEVQMENVRMVVRGDSGESYISEDEDLVDSSHYGRLVAHAASLAAKLTGKSE